MSVAAFIRFLEALSSPNHPTSFSLEDVIQAAPGNATQVFQIIKSLQRIVRPEMTHIIFVSCLMVGSWVEKAGTGILTEETAKEYAKLLLIMLKEAENFLEIFESLGNMSPPTQIFMGAHLDAMRSVLDADPEFLDLSGSLRFGGGGPKMLYMCLQTPAKMELVVIDPAHSVGQRVTIRGITDNSQLRKHLPAQSHFAYSFCSCQRSSFVMHCVRQTRFPMMIPTAMR